MPPVPPSADQPAAPGMPPRSITPLPQVVSRSVIHAGRKFNFELVEFRRPPTPSAVGGAAPTPSPSSSPGKTIRREIVRHPGAVAIVPILPDGRIVLIRVFRIALEAMSIECCAGTIERKPGTPPPPPEPPEVCAARELIEETGYQAARLTPLGSFYPSPGLSDELMHAYAATDLRHVGQRLEEDEHIEVFAVTPAEAWSMIQRAEIRDGKTITALLLAAQQGHISKP